MGVHGQTTNAMLFQMQAMWLKDIKEFLQINPMLKTLSTTKKKNLARKAKLFTWKDEYFID